jgi:hypothetical protein
MQIKRSNYRIGTTKMQTIWDEVIKNRDEKQWPITPRAGGVHPDVTNDPHRDERMHLIEIRGSQFSAIVAHATEGILKEEKN